MTFHDCWTTRHSMTCNYASYEFSGFGTCVLIHSLHILNFCNFWIFMWHSWNVNFITYRTSFRKQRKIFVHKVCTAKYRISCFRCPLSNKVLSIVTVFSFYSLSVSFSVTNSLSLILLIRSLRILKGSSLKQILWFILSNQLSSTTWTGKFISLPNELHSNSQLSCPRCFAS